MSQDEKRKVNKKQRHSKDLDAVLYPISLNESQNSSSVLSMSHNVSDTAHIISSGQYLHHDKQVKRDQDQLCTNNVSKMDLITSSVSEESALINVIESADLDQAIEILKRSHPISQNELDRALISSCHQGFKFLIQKLVSLKANVEVKDRHGNTPLLICAENGFFDIVSCLLRKKADVNAYNSAGNTALILSIKASGSSQVVKVLLEQAGIDITHQNRDGYTALMRAIEVRDISTIKLLMDKYQEGNFTCNESVNCKGETTIQIAERCGLGNVVRILNRSNRKRTPLVMATETCDIESFNILLDYQFVDEIEMKTSVNMALKKIFDNCRQRQDKVIGKHKLVMIRRLLECGASINMFGFNNDLVVAVIMGNYKLVELLCQHLQQQQQLGRYIRGIEALKAAAKSGRCDLVELLLQHHVDMNDGNYLNSPLDNALSHKHFECAQLLVKNGAAMDIGQALVIAVKQGEPGYMNFLLSNYKPDILNYAVNKADHFNKLLLSAARMGNVEIIKHLLDAGADVNHESSTEETPLSESKNGEVAKFLISRGANVKHVTHKSNTPLLNAVLCRHIYINEVVYVLLENGASVNGRNSEGKTPLILTSSKAGSVAVLKALLDHGANFNDQDDDGNTALIEAVNVGCSENVPFLLQFAKEKKYSIDVQNKAGLTALMCSVYVTSNKLCLQSLIDHGAEVNIKDLKGNTALLLHFLRSFFNPVEEILITLITAGSDVNHQNNDGFSPLMLAAKSRCDSYISTLIDAGADVNAVSKKDKTKTALTFLTDKRTFEKRYIQCIKVLLEGGASSSYASLSFLRNLILEGEIDIIPKLIRNGLGPTELSSLSDSFHGMEVNDSPLRIALMSGHVPLAKYFVGNLFLTTSDVSSLMTDKTLRHFLENKKLKNCLDFLDALSSQPMSLFQLAFVAVTSALGAFPGRENRVNALAVPQVMKDELLFQSENVTLSVPAKYYKIHRCIMR